MAARHFAERGIRMQRGWKHRTAPIPRATTEQMRRYGCNDCNGCNGQDATLRGKRHLRQCPHGNQPRQRPLLLVNFAAWRRAVAEGLDRREETPEDAGKQETDGEETPAASGWGVAVMRGWAGKYGRYEPVAEGRGWREGWGQQGSPAERVNEKDGGEDAKPVGEIPPEQHLYNRGGRHISRGKRRRKWHVGGLMPRWRVARGRAWVM